MKKLSIAEAADKLGISKEAVYNRIRRNSLKFIEEDGVKFVIFDDETCEKPEKKPKPTQDGEFVKYLIDEIRELKEKNELLQNEKEALFREKETLLIATKTEIKELYKERDEKLQHFLELLQKPLLTTIDVEPVEIPAQNEVKFEKTRENFAWIGLGEFLDRLGKKKKARKRIKKALLKTKSENVKFQNGSLFVRENLDLSEIFD